jgi:hypothetical protein
MPFQQVTCILFLRNIYLIYYFLLLYPSYFLKYQQWVSKQKDWHKHFFLKKNDKNIEFRRIFITNKKQANIEIFLILPN